MAEFNPYKLEEEKWTPKNVYEILPPNSVSWSDYEFGQGTDNVDGEAAKKSFIDGFVDFFKDLFGVAGQILGGAIELGGKILGGLVDGVVNLIGGIANAIGSIFGGGPSESPYPPMFSPIKANLEAAIQPFQDQIDESLDKSRDLLAEQLILSGQIAEQVDITRAAVEDAKAASERAGVAIGEAEAALAAAEEARETLEEYNTELNERITTEFNSAVGRANTAVDKADSLAQQLEDFKTRASADVEDALTKAQAANDELAALAPQIDEAVSNASEAIGKADSVTSAYNTFATQQKARIDTAVNNASNAVTKANDVTTAYNNFKIEQQARIDSAVSKAEAATANVNALTPQVEEAVTNSAAATADVAALTPQVSEAVANASSAVSKADQTLSNYTAWAATQKTRIDSAVSKAEAATANVATLSPQVADAVAKSTAATNDVSTLTPKVTKATSDAKAANDKVAELTPQVASAVSEAAAATANVSTLTPKVNDAATKATKASTDVSTLTPKVTKATTDAANAVSSVETLTPQVSDAAAKAAKASTDVSALSPKVDDAVAKANKATSDLSTLTPKVTAAQTRADNAFTEAGKVRDEVTPKIEAAQSKGETALAAADKAIADSELVAGFADDLLPKDEDGKPNWMDGRAALEDSPAASSFGSERSAIMETSFTFPYYFDTVKGQEVYRFTIWVKRPETTLSGALSFHILDENNQRVWKEARIDQGNWTTANSVFVTVPYGDWRKYTLDFRWPLAKGKARPRLQLNNGNEFYLHDPQVRVISPVDNSVDVAQNETLRAHSEILRQQGEINEAQRVANLAQKNFNDNQTKWNKASTDATKSLQDFATLQGVVNAEQTKFNNFQTDFNTKQTKWNKASEDATKALSDAQQVQSNLNIEQGKLNTLQSNFNTKQTEWNAGTTAALEAQKKVNDNFTKWNTAATQAKAAQDKLNEKQDEWNNGVTAALDAQKKVNDNFSKWSDGATTAIEANTKAIALLSAPQGASSIIPINPLTKEPNYLGWAGDRISVENIESVPTRTAVKYTATASKRIYAPSDQLIPVKVARGQVYRWVAWVYSNVANSSILLYFRDPATGTGTKATTHDAESKTIGHSSYGLFIRNIPSGWNKVSGTITFKDEISTLELYSIAWNQSGISSSVTQYITGFDIAPDVPTQAQVDAAQNKAIETFDLFMGKQDEWNAGTTAALDAQKKVNDNLQKWSDGAATAIEANTNAIKALNAPQIGSSIIPLVPGTEIPVWQYHLRSVPRADPRDAGLPEGIKTIYRYSVGSIPAGTNVSVSIPNSNVVMVDSTIEYEASWWVRASAGRARHIYVTLEDETGNQHVVEGLPEGSDYTGGNPIRVIITPATTEWTKYTTRFKFRTGVQFIRFSNIYFSNDLPTSQQAYLYIADLHIGPKIPTQASVDAAQNDAIAANTKAIALLNNPQAGASLVVTDPDTKRPNWAEKLEPATAAENPDNLPDAYKAVPNTGSKTARDMWVNIDPTTEYVVSLWAKADKTGSDMTYDIRDQDGLLAFTKSRAVDGFLNPGDNQRPYWIKNVPTTWKQYKVIMTPRATSRKVRFGSAYFNHSAGTTTNATQFVADFQIYPHVPSQAQVDDAQNKAIESLGILTAKQKEWSDGAEKAIQANTDVAVALARINGIQVGGRNLLRDSDVDVSNKDYLIARTLLGDSKPADGEEVTLSLKGELGAGVSYFAAYNSNGNGSSRLPSLDLRPEDRGSDGVYRRTGTWKSTAGNVALNLYTYPSSVTTITTVDWVKLERGNKSTDWTPAPEDLPTQKQVDDTQNTAIRANTDALKALGKKVLGVSLVPFRTPTDAEMENLPGLGYDPFSEPEYYEAGHTVDNSPGAGKRTPKAVSGQTSVGFRGSYITVDPKISYRVKFRTYAAAAGSGMSIAFLDQNGAGAVASSPFVTLTTTSGGYLVYRYELPKDWANHEGTITFKPGTTEVRLATFYWNTTAFSVSTTQRFFDLEIVPDIPDANVVNELQDNAIRQNTTVGTENRKAIDALTEGLDAYVAAADLIEAREEIGAELEQQSIAREELQKELNQAIVEAVPRTIVYNSGPQFNDHILLERSKLTAKGTWVGQILLDVTYVSKSDGSQTRRNIQNLTVPAPDGKREYSIPSASFGGYQPAYRVDYWVYQGKAIQKALSNSGAYLTGSTHKGNTWTQIATHTVKKTNGAVYFRWTTKLKKADRGRTYYFDVRVNGTSVVDKSFKGYGPLTSLGDGRATLTFSGTLSVPDNGTITIHTKSTGNATQAGVSSNKGIVSYLELE